jgi:hypothetical protein
MTTNNNNKENKWANKVIGQTNKALPMGSYIYVRDLIDDKELKQFEDLAIATEQQRIVGGLKKGLLTRMMKYDSKDGYSTLHDEIIEKVYNDVEYILDLITQKK